MQLLCASLDMTIAFVVTAFEFEFVCSKHGIFLKITLPFFEYNNRAKLCSILNFVDHF